MSVDRLKDDKSLFYSEQDAVKKIFEESDSESLILIDDYGRATSSINGISVFKGIVDTYSREQVFYHTKRECGCENLKWKEKYNLPMVFLSTNIRRTALNNYPSVCTGIYLYYRMMDNLEHG